MVDLLRPVSGTGKDDFIKNNLKYENGKWRSKIKFPGVAAFGVDAREEEGLIEIYPDGKGVGIITKNGARLNLSEEMAKQNPIEFVLSERIVNQPEFRALKVFSNARRIDASDVNQKDKTLTLLVGKSKLKIKLKYDGSKFDFADPADEQKLVQDKAFSEDYIDSLNDDSLFEFNKTIDSLKKLLKESCPEGFLKFFFKSLAVVHPKWHTPVACILAQGAWTIILTLSGTYEALYTYVVVIVFFFHAAIGIAVFVLRARKPDWPRPYRVSGYPLVPAVFILTSLAFVLNSLIERPIESLFGFIILLLGIPAFIYWRRAAARPS